MATVSVAYDNVRRHDVALKRLSAERFSDRGDLRRAVALFEREYFTLAELSHPRIVSVYDYGIDGAGPYYTMELLAGDSLRTRSPVPATTACELLRDVASALAIVHSRRLVHRDVTHLNVRCTPDGRAKLIDFGAMVPVGSCKDVVGTPPFVAPECLDLTSLDARTDLYALGACLYHALTGRHAYPARQMRQLRELWRTPPIAPSRWAPDVPESLDRLVLALLNLQPSGRPSSAAEVFERLTAIGKLEKAEEAGAARAYFTSPAIVGRDGPMANVRARLLSTVRGRGASVLVEGPAGAGRSRFLDAVALEARLLGLCVARADASDAQRGPFGVARRLMDAVLEVHPDLASELAARELSELAATAKGGSTLESQERLIEGTCELLCDAAKRRGWAFVVDDLHLVDEPSFAVLASVATQARAKRLALVTSVDSDARSGASSALALLAESSRKLSLAALDEADSRAVLASLTGEVPHLDTLSAVVYASCQGSPGRTIEAARALSDAGLLRYQGGTWLVESDPAAIEAVLARSHEGYAELLTPDADELLSVLALDRGRLLALADYAGLTAHRDPSRVHRALDELVRAGVLTPVGDRHRFTREAERAHVVRRLDAARRRELHLRLAEWSKGLAEPIYAVHHFLEAGECSLAVQPLVELRQYADRAPRSEMLRGAVTLDTLEKIAGMTDEELVGHGLGLEHGAAFMINALYQGAPERAATHARRALERLSFMSGLADYHRRTDLEPGARLGLALGAANERCVPPMALPGFDAISAVRRLCQLSIVTAVCARFLADASLLGALPDLSPYAVLSPAVGLAVRVTEALGNLVRGRDWLAWDGLKNLYHDLRGSVGESVDPLTRMTLETAVLGFLCAHEAEHATEAALGYIDTYSPTMPNLAESHRARYYLAFGDPAASGAARRRFEVLSVRNNGLFEARLTELPSHLSLYSLADDLLGLQRTVDAIERVAKVRPGWRPRLLLGRAYLHRSRGEIEPALRIAEAALQALGDSDAAWPLFAALHLDLLNRARRFSDVVHLGTGYAAHARDRGFPTALVDLALGEAHAECNDAESAEQCFETARSELSARGARGLMLGHCYEVGARIALRCGNKASFSERLKTCAGLYRRGLNPALTARYDALVREAAAQQADFDGPSRLATVSGSEQSAVSEVTATVVEGGERYLALFRRLSSEAGASGGVLYVNTAMGLVRRHATLGLAVSAELDEEAGRYFANEVSSDVVTGDAGESDQPERGLDVVPPSGTRIERFEPCLLEFHRDGKRHIVGVLVFALEGSARPSPRADALDVLAAQLAASPSVTAVEGRD